MKVLDGGEKTAKCTKSPGDSSDVEWVDGREGGNETRGDAGCGFGRLWIRDGWRRGGEGSRGDCRLPIGLEEINVLLHSERGSSSRHGLSTSSASGGRKETVSVGFTSSVFPYPPLSHSLFVALFCGISSLLRLLARIGHDIIGKLKGGYLEFEMDKPIRELFFLHNNYDDDDYWCWKWPSVLCQLLLTEQFTRNQKGSFSDSLDWGVIEGLELECMFSILTVIMVFMQKLT